jgi:transcriptional regulator with XRE-family HTH domain
LTLDQLGSAVGIAGSQLSLMENGKREPRISLLTGIAHALGVQVADLLDASPPNARAALEIELDRSQHGAVYGALGLPVLRAGKSMSDETLQALSGCTVSLPAGRGKRSRRPKRRVGRTPSSGCRCGR